MSSYRTRLFNSFVWLQTFLSLFVEKLTASLYKLLNVSSDHPSNPAFIQRLLEKKFDHLPPLTGVEKSPEALPGRGLASLTYKVLLKYSSRIEDEAKDAPPATHPQSLVFKQGREGFQSRLWRTFLQSAREAIFYKELVPRLSILSSCVPEVYHSSGSLLTGEFMIVMEDLTGKSVPASLLLGDQCWGGSAAVPKEMQGTSEHEVIRTIFLQMAGIHARFWRDGGLMKKEWMHGVRWRQGYGRLSWEASFDNMRSRWNSLMCRRAYPSRADFTNLQLDVVERLFKQTSWSTWQRENNVAPFTLIHGDFHAGNVLWRLGEEVDRAVFVDWSEVGIGCPFTELAQFMISNATVEFRRENERQIFAEYYSRLVELGVDSAEFTQEQCWKRYELGGIERWLQLLILLAAFKIPEFAFQWFSNQVNSFMQDHSSSIPHCFNTVYCLPIQ